MVAEVGRTVADDQVYRLTYDGSVAQEQQFAVMGGSAEQITRYVAENYRDDLTLQEALRLAVEALGRDSGDDETRTLTSDALEVAILDRDRPRRRFRRIVSPELDELLSVPDEPPAAST